VAGTAGFLVSKRLDAAFVAPVRDVDMTFGARHIAMNRVVDGYVIVAIAAIETLRSRRNKGKYQDCRDEKSGESSEACHFILLPRNSVPLGIATPCHPLSGFSANCLSPRYSEYSGPTSM
jgi:hypothetical protein